MHVMKFVNIYLISEFILCYSMRACPLLLFVLITELYGKPGVCILTMDAESLFMWDSDSDSRTYCMT